MSVPRRALTEVTRVAGKDVGVVAVVVVVARFGVGGRIEGTAGVLAMADTSMVEAGGRATPPCRNAGVIPLVFMAVAAAAAAGFTEREGGELELRGRNELAEHSRPGVRATGATTLSSVVMVTGASFDTGAVIAPGVVEARVELEAEADGAVGADATTGFTEDRVTAFCATTSDISNLPISALEGNAGALVNAQPLDGEV